MKRNSLVLAIATLLLTVAFYTGAQAQTRFGLRLEFGGPAPVLNQFYVSLGNEYDVPYGEICTMHDAGVSDYDIPTILYIHAHSPYSLRQIYSLRLNGATWDQLSSWCGVSLTYGPTYDRYYRSGPPFGNAYGYYRHGPGRWERDQHFDRGDGERGHGRGHGRERDDN